MMLFRPALLAAALLAFALPAAHAQWKWRDTNGIIQFSDLPPPAGVPERNILQRPTAANLPTARLPDLPAAAASAPAQEGAVPAGASPKGVDPELDARRRDAEAAKKKADEDKKKSEETKLAAARTDSCQRARAHQKMLDEGIRMARMNEKGEREFLDDRQRAEESRRTRDIIATDCR